MRFIKKIIKSNKYTYKITKYLYSYLNRGIYKLMYLNAFKKYVDSCIKNVKKNNIFFMLVQEHGNLGDIAIGYAQKSFLVEKFPEYNVIDITEREYNIFKKYIKTIIGPKDIITLIGGGSLGDQYIKHEFSRKDIIKEFRENKIISFPQSMYFKDKKLEEESGEIYSLNRNLKLIARDKISYELMKKRFINNKILLTPDIVLYLNKTFPKLKREGALTLIRSDIEGVLTQKEKEFINNTLNSRYRNVKVSDTIVDSKVPRHKAEKEIENLFGKIKQAELVVTDRLHGMIFAAITSTPCIVISNYNHKIRGQYDWLRHLKYIKFIDDIKELNGVIEELNGIIQMDYENNFTEEFFKQICKDI